MVETLWNTPSRILILHQIESSPLIMNVGLDSHRNPEESGIPYELWATTIYSKFPIDKMGL